MSDHPLFLLIRLMRPFFLIGGIGQYILGVGIARYLGATIDWSIFWAGQLWVTSIQLSAQLLNEYFDAPEDAFNNNRTLFSGGSGVLGEGDGKLPRYSALLAAAAMLTTAALVTLSWTRDGNIGPGLGTVMTLIVFGAIFYSVPPIRLAASGIGEITTAAIIGSLVPMFGYLLQEDQPSRMVMFATLPLTLLMIAAIINVELPDFATDIKFEKRNLLVRLGWDTGIAIHNACILFAFVALGVGGLSGLPRIVSVPAFIPLPLGLIQIWMMRRLVAGAKPNWTLLALNGFVIFGMTSYLMAFIFWTR